MRAFNKAAVISLFFLLGCQNKEQLNEPMPFLAKELLNSNWQEQALGDEEWFYRMTVVEASANTEAMGLAEGHYLHPDLLRFEITKDLLIGYSTHQAMLNAEKEQKDKDYRAAPVVAFPILAHFDISKSPDGYIKSSKKPWQKRAYLDVDWSKNLITGPKNSENDGQSLISNASYMVDALSINDPKRMRIGADYIDVTARYPAEISEKAMRGAYGLAYKEDTAGVMIDVRHFFMKKAPSDFVPLPSPDFVLEKDSLGDPVIENGKPKKIAINRRFGLFRINLDGRLVRDADTGDNDINSNATIFNVWQKSRDENGIIPLEKREVKPIVYYMNVLHPEDLKESSFEVARSWDLALREMVFYAQPKKYATLDDVPSMWVLKPNSCSLDEVKRLLNDHDLKEKIEAGTLSIEKIEDGLKRAQLISKAAFSKSLRLELASKRQLEKICAALEYYTKDKEEKFIYQRPGDLRFNLLNLEMGNNTTSWSGYGPMFADPITGEIISASANINMKYIDLTAQKMAKQIGLLKEANPGLLAVFGSGSGKNEESRIDEGTIRSINERLETRSFQSTKNFTKASQSTVIDEQEFHKALENFADKPEVEDKKQGLMDSLRYVDNIAIGIAIKFADLPEHERFLKIRELIYKSVAQHELGHNLGLRHNHAGASDVLNYGEKYWQLELLPADISAALKKVTDPQMKEDLQHCLKEQEHKAFFVNGKKTISTQDCLWQKNGMYSSIMDYHASSLADVDGLGLYDKAAVKWAYGQLLEIFPEENLLIDTDQLEISRWLSLNYYRHIPRLLLKNVSAINERKYYKFSWDQDKNLNEMPKNAVPYAYCDDSQGIKGPRCLAFDFGPDMRSSAMWLRDRFWQQYLFNHFAKDQTWGSSEQAIADDIDNLKRFTNILRWYSKNKEDPEFSGSYAEKDYLAALGIGLNHFAHVLGMPESGAHVSAPIWKIEEELALPKNVDRTKAASVLIPAKLLSSCDAKSITSIDEQGKITGRFNFHFAEVPLGMGRPLNSGLSDDLEEKNVLYAGTNFVKKYALYQLMAPLLNTKEPALLENEDLLSMTWYRMFPQAVSKIYSAVIASEYYQLGPLVKEDGTLVPRDIISLKTHRLLDYKNQPSIMPATESDLSLFAAEVAITFMPEAITQDENLLRSLKITCKGCRDEVDYAESNQSMVHFSHFGQEYSASIAEDSSSIGAELLVKAQVQKERYLRLKDCLSDEKARTEDPFCHCVKTTDRKTYADWVCCDENNESCLGPTLEKVGEGVCSILDLQKRMSQSLGYLKETVGFIDSLRALMKQASL